MMFRAQDEALYLTDNGACLCGAHLGASAKFTGRDISGQPIELVTPAHVREALSIGCPLSCESCGRVASLEA
jgi:hypothetical protein